MPLGVQVLKVRGYFAEAKWYWIGVGALIGFILLFNVFYVIALTLLNGEFPLCLFTFKNLIVRERRRIKRKVM